MATKTKKPSAKQRSEASKKAAATRKANEAKREKAAETSSKVPQPFDDTTTRADDQAVPGHFVEVVSGPHKGRYGVLVDRDQYSNNVVVRTRDSASERLLVKYSDLRPSEAGHR